MADPLKRALLLKGTQNLTGTDLLDYKAQSKVQSKTTTSSTTRARVRGRTVREKGAPRRRGGKRGKSGRSGGVVRTKSGQSVNKMLRKAEKWDKAEAPYLWGGGHGAKAKAGDPVDCSGFVSSVLELKTPQVSGNLARWGKKGKGKNVTVYANDGHTLMSIRDPKTKKTRFFGTSGSNPNGGAGEIANPGKAYLSNLQARRPG